MKKAFLFLFFLLTNLANMPVFAQKDMNGCFISHRNNENKLLKLLIQDEIPKVKVEYDSVRPLTEINDPVNADAYPWISPDGLRLYYTKGFDSLKDKIFYAERLSLLVPFSNIRALSINFDDIDTFSPWLTKDELDIYFIAKKSSGNASTTLFHSTRKTKNDDFSNPVEVKLNILIITGFLSSPSFTQDKSILYINNYYQNYRRILVYKKTSEDEYNYLSSLIIPEGYILGTGKLTKDDLKYYLSLYDSISYMIYYFERKDTSENFDSLYYIDNKLINDTNYYNIQPSLSENENILVFTRNNNGYWDGNDLYIAYKKQTAVQDNNSLSNNSISAYPNPFSESTILKYNLSEPSFVKINIFNTFGNKIITLKNEFKDAGEHQEIFEAGNLSPGVYFYTIQIGRQIENGKLLLFK